MMPDRMIHTSFSQDFGPFVIDFIKLDFFKSTFEFVTHFIDILQSLHGKKRDEWMVRVLSFYERFSR